MEAIAAKKNWGDRGGAQSGSDQLNCIAQLELELLPGMDRYHLPEISAFISDTFGAGWTSRLETWINNRMLTFAIQIIQLPRNQLLDELDLLLIYFKIFLHYIHVLSSFFILHRLFWYDCEILLSLPSMPTFCKCASHGQPVVLQVTLLNIVVSIDYFACIGTFLISLWTTYVHMYT